MQSFWGAARAASRTIRTQPWRQGNSFVKSAGPHRTLSAQWKTARPLHTVSPRKSASVAAESTDRDSSNPAMSFPCLDAQEAKSAQLSARSLQSGPEPSYTTGRHESYHCEQPLLLDWGGVLPEFDIAYETWGQLNGDKSNAILLHTGLSASSHAHSTASNPKPGWWEKFIGPGLPLDTDKYHIICTNVLGGCYGRIKKLAASVGSSMGGMQSLAAGVLFPERVNKIVSISGCARSHPYSIAMRHTQRQVLMMDPNWARGFYYDGIPPHSGMKLAREIATVTYRSGPEWEMRFGRQRADPSKQPALCPDFLIETYLDHAGEKFCLEYDANSLLYVSKAMDLFDLGHAHQTATMKRRAESEDRIAHGGGAPSASDPTCSLTLPDKPYEEQPGSTSNAIPLDESVSADSVDGPPRDLVAGLAPLKDHPVLVMGVASDILFPAWQQREIAETLRAGGNKKVEHIELGDDLSLFGHDTFLLDLKNIGGALGKFLR
ncbi:hypothetical protein N7530_007697 [Penicillium desertorum]|uniref:AB hydrolase-1 domain-containing protein n=1 Tax=Penicillium desertorum TaxID=1303715 RepID=A0A9W9WMP2_9EURO|nr:hypothetical protein N7530_007697 [Penicillium desertorum]